MDPLALDGTPVPEAAVLAKPDALIVRDRPEPGVSRGALVIELTAAVKSAKGKWQSAFKRMREDQNFAAGKQWPGSVLSVEAEDERYVANIVQRHIQQRTAVLYAKNPKAVAKRRERIDYTVWDGTEAQYRQAEMGVQQAAMMGMPPPPAMLMVMQDHDKVMQQRKMLDRVGKTLEILYQHYVDEQVYSFKSEMKRLVRRVITCGVGYSKIGFQRIMEKTPDVQRQLADFQMQLAHLQAMTADIADGETDPQGAEGERLRLVIEGLSAQAEVLVREGLTFDFPSATAIIPDGCCRSIATFAGCNWVAEEFLLSCDEVKGIYQVDVKPAYNAYAEMDQGLSVVHSAYASLNGAMDTKGHKRDVLLWLIYHKQDGLVYTVVDGYPDFLEEPACPVPLLERFYPWFTLLFNELDHEEQIFPLSDVRLMRHQQQEYNRSREGLREHRMANRPMTVTANGQLDDEDREKLRNRPANAVVELNALQPGQDVKAVLQPFQGPTLDPALYDPAACFQDVLRVVGTQEANLGGTSNATATESSIAEGSRMSSMESNVDDLDDFLTEVARAGGQIMLGHLDGATVREIAGPGAAWPELDRKTITTEVLLQVEAGSSGRPNKAQEVANLERVMPFLLQLPGVNPEWLAREAVRRMDDRIDLAEATQVGAMSAMATNSQAKGNQAQPGAGGGGAAPGGPPAPQQGGGENQENPLQSENQPARPGRPPMKPVSPGMALQGMQ